MEVVLVVTPVEAELDRIVECLAHAGYHAFAALPSAAPSLRRCATFDLVVDAGEDGAFPEYLVRTVQRRLAST